MNSEFIENTILRLLFAMRYAIHFFINTGPTTYAHCTTVRASVKSLSYDLMNTVVDNQPTLNLGRISMHRQQLQYIN